MRPLLSTSLSLAFLTTVGLAACSDSGQDATTTTSTPPAVEEPAQTGSLPAEEPIVEEPAALPAEEPAAPAEEPAPAQ